MRILEKFDRTKVKEFPISLYVFSDDGTATCRAGSDEICPQLQVTRLGFQYICGLYNKPLYDDDWIRPCEQCLEESGIYSTTL